MLLNLDGGEHDDEPAELYALADIVHVACGGHAGDAASIRRVTELCRASGTRVGAHPSYVDREGFGRRALEVEPELLARQIEEQCRAVHDATSVKPHGALYHAAHADAAVADAVVKGIARALGPVAIVGLGGGELERAARAAGHPYLREAFADRGVRADGSMIPRGEPGALIVEPALAAERARAIVAAGGIETLCCHADTPSSLAIVRAVRAALG
ncbi:MAG: LamB/YcsF family protein [Labilithrix sp.]|nr:LamB/YcsF family protein [Labilithrix sp.]MCW5812746.1 LamB/YcsF family protein [Labilithrix sp.]